MKAIAEAAKSVNRVLMFVLELVVYAVAAYWAWTQVPNPVLKFLCAIGLVVLLAMIWARWGAPTSPVMLTGRHRALLELPWFGSAYVFLLLLGRPDFATGFAFWYGLNTTLRILWKQIQPNPPAVPDGSAR